MPRDPCLAQANRKYARTGLPGALAPLPAPGGPAPWGWGVFLVLCGVAGLLATYVLAHG